MRITMMYTRRVADGTKVRELGEGRTYDVEEEAARHLIRQKQAYQEGFQPPAPAPSSPFTFSFGNLTPRVPTNPKTHQDKGTPL